MRPASARAALNGGCGGDTDSCVTPDRGLSASLTSTDALNDTAINATDREHGAAQVDAALRYRKQFDERRDLSPECNVPECGPTSLREPEAARGSTNASN